MKKLLLSFLFILIFIPAFNQQLIYQTESNIQYYSGSVNQKDKSIKEKCVLDIYYPVNIKRFATVVWFHGGGLETGDKTIEYPEGLKGNGICVVNANYRMYPGAKCPDYLEDAAAAVTWVFKNIERFGGDPNLIFLSGHSAGGYLVSMIGLDKRWLGANGIDANKIAGLIPLSGHTITHFNIRKERGIPDKQPLVDEFAPLYHVRADAPPLLLITGDRELEILGRYEENAYLMRMMKLNGHTNTTLLEMQGYNHEMEEPALPLLLEFVRKTAEQIKNKSDKK